MPSSWRLFGTFLWTVALTVALTALLLRPGSDLKPLRSTTMDLDEPAPGAAFPP